MTNSNKCKECGDSLSLNEIGAGLCKDCFLQIERDKKYSLAKKLMQHRFHDYWDVLDEDDFYDLVSETIEEFKNHITQSNGCNTVLEKYTAKNKGCTPIVETESIFRLTKEESTDKQKYNLYHEIKSILPTIKDGYSYNEAVAEKLLNYVLGKISESEEKGYIKGYKQACEDNPQRGKLK